MCTQVSYVYVAAKVNERVNLWVFFFFFFFFFSGRGEGWETLVRPLSEMRKDCRYHFSVKENRETYVEYSKSVNSGCINQAVGLSKCTIFILSQLSDDILSDGVGKRLRYQGSKRFEKERKASSY